MENRLSKFLFYLLFRQESGLIVFTVQKHVGFSWKIEIYEWQKNPLAGGARGIVVNYIITLL